jgi:hypothetical protein
MEDSAKLALGRELNHASEYRQERAKALYASSALNDGGVEIV